MSLTLSSRRALLAALLSCLSGCFLKSAAVTDVAQGRYFAAGSPEYDEFFLAVHRLQLQMASAPRELAEARHALGEAVIAAPDSSNAQLAAKVNAALERLSEHGIRTRVEFRTPSPPNPEHSMAILTPSSSPAGSDRQTFERIESALTGILRFAASMRLASEKLADLRGAAPRLEAGVDATFSQQSRRRKSEIENNLRDAERVAVLMLARADVLGKPADDLAGELMRTLAKPSATVPVSEPSAKVAETPRPRQRAGQDSRARAAPAPAEAKPKSQAAPEPAKPADFEP